LPLRVAALSDITGNVVNVKAHESAMQSHLFLLAFKRPRIKFQLLIFGYPRFCLGNPDEGLRTVYVGAATKASFRRDTFESRENNTLLPQNKFHGCVKNT